MSDIIQLLPDSVANQIAAGEVIQRPASVVKELVENAIDAGATEIRIVVKDAGRTLIQVTDNGNGMSPTDARMAFERHATSKITSANDLFAIRTMGFRGEALASIAAVSEVEIRTRKPGDDLGTFIHINGSEILTQEPVACSTGTTILVKNLFFNVPARRKFLKAISSELKYILIELQRVALPNPDLAFSLHHNQSVLYDLPEGNHRKRIVSVFGKSINQSLIPVEVSTNLLSLNGYVGQPQYARKTMGEQFFFVNKRFMRHPYLHKAVMQAFEKLIPSDAFPSYFFFLDIDPAAIDINVHPTKTEIKFENENAVWQIINAAVRESLGKHNVVPSIDFDQEGSIDIPMPPKDFSTVTIPGFTVNPDYNPFNEGQGIRPDRNYGYRLENPVPKGWEKLFEGAQRGGLPQSENEAHQTKLRMGRQDEFSAARTLQVKQKYLFTPVKSGLMVIDQKRAHERILYEKFLDVLKTQMVASQQQLFPQTFELNPADTALLNDILPDLGSLGFDIREFGLNTFIINGLPGILDTGSPLSIVEKLLEEYKNSPVDARRKAKEQIAQSLAKASALDYTIELKPEEASQLIDNLFACETPNYSPDGKPVLLIIPIDEIEKRFS